MELGDKEELIKARATLDRHIQVLYMGRSVGSYPRQLITKLENQLKEIDALLEGVETDCL